MDRISQLDTSIEIVTPENIAFQHEVAGPFRRLPAFILDLSIRAVVILIAGFTMAVLGWIVGSAGFAVMLVLWFLLEWFYGALFETYMNGQTPGKRVMGIRVVSTSGHPIGGLQAVMRNILRGVDMMPILPLSAFDEQLGAVAIPTFAIGLVCQAFSARFQRLGDIVCGTMVVVDERRRRPNIRLTPEPRVVALAEKIPASFPVDRQLHRALAAYIERRPRISSARRRDLAKYVAELLVERFDMPSDTNFDLLLCALHWKNQPRGAAEEELVPMPDGKQILATASASGHLAGQVTEPVTEHLTGHLTGQAPNSTLISASTDALPPDPANPDSQGTASTNIESTRTESSNPESS